MKISHNLWEILGKVVVFEIAHNLWTILRQCSNEELRYKLWQIWKLGATMPESSEIAIVTAETIQDKIYIVRGQQVMLSTDLADIYGYDHGSFNRQVRNNIERFADDFRFQLTKEETEYLRCNFCTANISSKSRSLPYVFTEQGLFEFLNKPISVKTFGNIVCFRDLQDEVDEAMSVYGDSDAGGMVLLKPYAEYFAKYMEYVNRLLATYPLGEWEALQTEEAKKDFVTVFGSILRLRNVLSAWDQFEHDDPLEPRQV